MQIVRHLLTFLFKREVLCEMATLVVAAEKEQRRWIAQL